MEISQTLKKLRRDHNMTQEELAGLLSLSPQAISRWENGSAMPDISLIPSICHVFDISSDFLLGVDITRKEEHIKKMSEEINQLFMRDHYFEARKIIEEGLSKYPNNNHLMCLLMHATYGQSKCAQSEKDATLYANECINLGEKLLKLSNDDNQRHEAIQTLCFLYAKQGNMVRARELVNKMPSFILSKEWLTACIERGTERQKAVQCKTWLLFNSFLANMTLNVQLDDGTFTYTSDEEAILRNKAISLIQLFYEDGNAGHTHCIMSKLCLDHAVYFAEKRDSGNTISNLENAVDSIIKYCQFVTTKNFTNTSLLLKGRPFHFDRVSYLQEKEKVQEILDAMAKHVFDFVRDEPAFIEIERRICNCAESNNS